MYVVVWVCWAPLGRTVSMVRIWAVCGVRLAVGLMVVTVVTVNWVWSVCRLARKRCVATCRSRLRPRLWVALVGRLGWVVNWVRVVKLRVVRRMKWMVVRVDAWVLTVNWDSLV